MLHTIRPFLWPLAFLLLAALLWVTHAHDAMGDVEVYHTAAVRVLAGDSPYQPADARPFLYMPIVAVAMAPFALFRQDAAMFLWFAASVGLLTAFVRWSIHGLPERRRNDEVLQWIVLVVMLPFFAHELAAGQVDIVLGVLLVGALLAVQVELPRVGGVLVGLAVFLEPYVLLLLPWLALAHGLRAVLATVMVLAAGLLVPIAVFGWTGNVQLLVDWFAIVGVSPDVTGGVSLGAMWTTWFGTGRVAPFLTIVSMGAVVGLIAVTYVRRQAVLEPDYLEVALVMLAIPLLSSSASMWLVLLATPAVVCLLDRWGDMPARWRVVGGVSVGVMSLAAIDLFGSDTPAALARSAVVTVAASVLLVVVAGLRRKGLA